MFQCHQDSPLRPKNYTISSFTLSGGGSNPWPLDDNRTFHATETHYVTQPLVTPFYRTTFGLSEYFTATFDIEHKGSKEEEWIPVYHFIHRHFFLHGGFCMVEGCLEVLDVQVYTKTLDFFSTAESQLRTTLLIENQLFILYPCTKRPLSTG